MVNKEKVRQMSRLAVMESDLGEKEIRVCSCRKLDYVTLQVLRGFIGGSVCFAAFLILWFCFQWDDLNLIFADAQFHSFIWKVLIGYIVFMAAYLFLCVFVALKHYRDCEEKRKRYLRYLKTLERFSDPGEDVGTDREETWFSS